MEPVLHPCARQRLPSLRSPAPQSPRTGPREDQGDAGKVLELLIPGEAPESVVREAPESVHPLLILYRGTVVSQDRS